VDHEDAVLASTATIREKVYAMLRRCGPDGRDRERGTTKDRPYTNAAVAMIVKLGGRVGTT
jgi:hypothetical protein